MKKIYFILLSIISILGFNSKSTKVLNAFDTPEYKREITLSQAYLDQEDISGWTLEFDNSILNQSNIGTGPFEIETNSGYLISVHIGEEADVRKYDNLHITTSRIELFNLNEVSTIVLPNDFGKLINFDENTLFNSYCLLSLVVDNPILGPDKLTTNCTSILSESDILNNYSSLFEGIISIRDNNYSANANFPGTYSITLVLTQVDNTKSTRIINIIVRDNIAPMIKVIDNNEFLITSYLSNPLSTTEIINRLSVTDNYDNNLKGSLIYDASNYLNNKDSVGLYTIEFFVSDSSGNTTSQIIKIQVVNDKGPIIQGPTTIHKSASIVFNTTDVLNTISSVIDQDGNEISLRNASGEIDSRFFKVTFDSLTGNADKPGTYLVKLKATDVKKRSSIYTFTVNVYSDIPNVVYYNNTIYTTSDVILSQGDLIKISSKFGLTSYSGSNALVTFLVNEYELYDYLPGHAYSVKIRFVAPSGHEEYVNYTIKVFDGESQVVPKKNFLTEIVDFLIKFLSKYLFPIISLSVAVFIYFKRKNNKKPKRNWR